MLFLLLYAVFCESEPSDLVPTLVETITNAKNFQFYWSIRK